MNPTLVLLVGTIIGFLIAILRGRSISNKADAQILDLTNKIADKKKYEAATAKKADDAVKEYLDELKKYDPDFHNDDDGDGKPTG